MGASVGQFFGLRSWLMCGEANGAAVADATAVDMVWTKGKGERAEVRYERKEKKNNRTSEGTGVPPLLDK